MDIYVPENMPSSTAITQLSIKSITNKIKTAKTPLYIGLGCLYGIFLWYFLINQIF